MPTQWAKKVSWYSLADIFCILEKKICFKGNKLEALVEFHHKRYNSSNVKYYVSLLLNIRDAMRHFRHFTDATYADKNIHGQTTTISMVFWGSPMLINPMLIFYTHRISINRNNINRTNVTQYPHQQRNKCVAMLQSQTARTLATVAETLHTLIRLQLLYTHAIQRHILGL